MIHGSRPTLLNVNYIRPSKDTDEAFEVIYKSDTGQVHRSYEPAEADIYFVKPEFRDFTHNKPQERMNRLEKRRVPISKIKEHIAIDKGYSNIKEFNEPWYSDDRSLFKYNPISKEVEKITLNKYQSRLYAHPYSFGADFQPEFYFMRDWYAKYGRNPVKLTKAFMDIEVDMMDHIIDLNDIKNTAHAAVNCVTIIFEETNESMTFILRPQEPSRLSYGGTKYQRRYELYEKQLEQHKYLLANKDRFIKELNADFDGMYGYIKYGIREYDCELEMIKDIFRALNDRKPNFCLLWNMRFDIQYLYFRIKVLTGSANNDPTECIKTMCHSDFLNPKCYFHEDRMIFQLEKQYDYFYCSSYTQFICQMRLYASIRKSQQMLKSVALNAIADRELKDKKVEYAEETNMMFFPYHDWWRFIKYNIKDTLLQKGIEKKTNDVLTYYSKSHANLTPYSKIFRETHLLRNVREMYFNEDGWVQGNNVNIIESDDDPLWGRTEPPDDDSEDEGGESTFKGAIMADPIWNAKVGIPILGQPSNTVFPNAMDYDMAAFYPSIKIACNMDPGTLLYKAEFDNEEFMSGTMNNRSLNQDYQERDKFGRLRNLDITGEAVHHFVSGNILSFGYNYLGFPGIDELYRDVLNELGLGGTKIVKDGSY